MAAVSARDFGFAYPGQATPVLDGVSFTVPAAAFVAVCGPTGCGKSTLLRHMVPALRPVGRQSGSIEVAGSVGFVAQDPEAQIVCDTVVAELAFGSENAGLATPVIRRRVSEVASFFGMDAWLERSVHTLSGGQKQMVTLAAALAVDPQVLVLDEPTARLDPIAAQAFIQALARANGELGCTVLCVEHRLDEVLPLADRVLYLRDSGCRAFADVQSFVGQLRDADDAFVQALPAPTRVAVAVGAGVDGYPLDVRAGRALVSAAVDAGRIAGDGAGGAPPADDPTPPDSTACAIEIRDLSFRYGTESDWVLRRLTGGIRAGSIHAIVGGNGVGKSTLFALICGDMKPQMGRIRIREGLRLAALVQNPKALFTADTLRGELEEKVPEEARGGVSRAVPQTRLGYKVRRGLFEHVTPPRASERMTAVESTGIDGLVRSFGLLPLMDRHPYDLSGGEQQLAALVKVLARDPDIVLLDEPTKGLDAQMKARLGGVLRELNAQGRTVVFVTHDLEFAAEYAQVCSLLAQGQLVATEPVARFFDGNRFYTTAVNRMTRGMVQGCVTVDDLVARWS
ncbi:MAG: ATP-binding cassette domain-containing protein [Actinomycetes bacterium]|nr:ATP-binding cassette domain-containing protein [Actinomycetes bacterium]